MNNIKITSVTRVGGSGNAESPIDHQLMAVIMAAVSMTVQRARRQRGVRIVRNTPGNTWQAFGRMSIQSSHRTRKGSK
jgi:hypothetical protein